MEKPVDRMQLLTEWWTAQNQLQALKDKEMQLRKEVSRYFFDHPRPGTNRCDIGNGYNLVLEYKIDVKMDFKAFDELLKGDEAEQLGLVKSDVVKYKPNFKEGAFKKLSKEKQDFIEQVLTRKPAAPAMRIEQGRHKKEELPLSPVVQSLDTPIEQDWGEISRNVVVANGYRWAKEQIEAGVDVSDIEICLSQLNNAEDFIEGADKYLNEIDL